MNIVAVDSGKTIDESNIKEIPLERILIQIARHGQPRLSLMDGGWYCVVGMYVSSEFATFDIKSDFGHSSPAAAAGQCLLRVQQTLRSLVSGKLQAP